MNVSALTEEEPHSDDDGFVLVDDNGNVLEAEEEQSCWMAVQYGADVVEDTSGWYAEEFAKAVQDGRWVQIEKCGHNVHTQNTPGFLEALRPFLADL